jgi:hypothetical protein
MLKKPAANTSKLNQIDAYTYPEYNLYHIFNPYPRSPIERRRVKMEKMTGLAGFHIIHNMIG